MENIHKQQQFHLRMFRLMVCVFFSFISLFKWLEHGLQSTLAHPPTINNNNNSSSINNNNNHGTKSGTNSTKLTSAAANDDHQQLIATIHRNDKASATATASTATNKIVATPKVKSKAIAKPRLNDNLIEFSINDSIDGNTSSCDELNATTIDAATAATTLIGDQIQRNLNQTQLPKPTPSDLNVIRANKTIVALSILIQHLTTDVSVLFCFVSLSVASVIGAHMIYSIVDFAIFSLILRSTLG